MMNKVILAAVLAASGQTASAHDKLTVGVVSTVCADYPDIAEAPRMFCLGFSEGVLGGLSVGALTAYAKLPSIDRFQTPFEKYHQEFSGFCPGQSTREHIATQVFEMMATSDFDESSRAYLAYVFAARQLYPCD